MAQSLAQRRRTRAIQRGDRGEGNQGPDCQDAHPYCCPTRRRTPRRRSCSSPSPRHRRRCGGPRYALCWAVLCWASDRPRAPHSPPTASCQRQERLQEQIKAQAEAGEGVVARPRAGTGHAAGADGGLGEVDERLLCRRPARPEYDGHSASGACQRRATLVSFCGSARL